MLTERILSTLRFFDLQDVALTAYEVHRYLVSSLESLTPQLDNQFELPVGKTPIPTQKVGLDTVQHHLDQLVASSQIASERGFYALPGRQELISLRLKNYLYGIPRERLIWRYMKFTAHLPFVRGIALAGSQALGLQRPTSDIDLFIFTQPNRMWIARTCLTVYFHLLRIRRHGKKIANRFCLNHYLSNLREVDIERNLYKAMEYTKLRPLVYHQTVLAFQKANQSWIKLFFPNVTFEAIPSKPQSSLQKFFEWFLNNSFGSFLEARLAAVQLSRIKTDKYIFVKDDELSFHPESKHEALLKGFFL